MSNAHTFRAFARIEDQMVRAAMPLTNIADPVTLPTFRTDRPKAACWSHGKRTAGVAPLTFTISEVAHV